MLMGQAGGTTASPSWRRREDYTSMYLTGRGWAWQILRRNRTFREQLANRRPAFTMANETPQLRVIAGPVDLAFTRRWGPLCVECTVSGQAAAVLWEPVLSATILRMTAFDASRDPSISSFDVRGLGCPATLFRAPDGMQHLLVQDGGHELQLAVRGADIRKPASLLFDAMAPSMKLTAYLEALRNYNYLLKHGRLLSAPRCIDNRSARLQIVLQALDGDLAGASRRDIACALFGNARVEKEWNDPNDLLRNRVRHAIRRARMLLDGGYLRFLR